jgi:hypothetical protein
VVAHGDQHLFAMAAPGRIEATPQGGGICVPIGEIARCEHRRTRWHERRRPRCGGLSRWARAALGNIGHGVDLRRAGCNRLYRHVPGRAACRKCSKQEVQ